MYAQDTSCIVGRSIDLDFPHFGDEQLALALAFDDLGLLGGSCPHTPLGLLARLLQQLYIGHSQLAVLCFTS